MKLQHPTRSRSSESSESEMDAQIREEVRDAIAESNVEIKPANESGGRGKLALIALIGGVIAIGYWLRKSQQPTKMLQSAASEIADRTKHVTEQTADTIQEGGETVTERVEEGSEKASEQVEQTSETVAERIEERSEKASETVEQTGETVAEEAEEAGEKAAKKTNKSGSS